VPGAGLVGQHADELELNRVTFAASLDLGRVGIIARHLQEVDRVPLVNLDESRGVGIVIDQGNDKAAFLHILSIGLDGAVKARGWRRLGERGDSSQRGDQAYDKNKGEYRFELHRPGQPPPRQIKPDD
jgi:hypothetical protein